MIPNTRNKFMNCARIGLYLDSAFNVARSGSFLRDLKYVLHVVLRVVSKDISSERKL